MFNTFEFSSIINSSLVEYNRIVSYMKSNITDYRYNDHFNYYLNNEHFNKKIVLDYFKENGWIICTIIHCILFLLLLTKIIYEMVQPNHIPQKTSQNYEYDLFNELKNMKQVFQNVEKCGERWEKYNNKLITYGTKIDTIKNIIDLKELRNYGNAPEFTLKQLSHQSIMSHSFPRVHWGSRGSLLFSLNLMKTLQRVKEIVEENTTISSEIIPGNIEDQ